MAFTDTDIQTESNQSIPFLPIRLTPSLLPTASPIKHWRRTLALGVGAVLLFCLGLCASLQWFSASANSAGSQLSFYMPATGEAYWRSLTLAQAQKDFANWNRQDLAKLFATVDQQTDDPVIHQRLTALSQSLRLPGSDSSGSSSLFDRPVIFLGLILSFAPILVAIVLVVGPLTKKKSQARDALPMLDETAEEVAAGGSLEEIEIEPESVETPAPNAETKAAETPQEETEQTDPGLGDLASLFEEEDTSLSVLETFCKGMLDVNIEDLRKVSVQIIQRFANGRSPSKSEELT